MLRSNRGGGVIEPGCEGSAWLLNVIADDQAHLIFAPEFGLHKDNATARGESLMTTLERRAEASGDVVSFNLNTHIPKWVMEQEGVEEEWVRFEKLFLVDFTSGREYFTCAASGDAGIVGCTAEHELHRRPGLPHRTTVREHMLRLPAKKSIATHVTKRVRLVITPPVTESGADVTSGAAVLAFRTKVTDIVDDDTRTERPATEAIQHVRRAQLVMLCEEYREQYDGDDEADRPALRDMTVDARNGAEHSLRCELWAWFEAKGLLADDVLQGIFDDSVLGDFTWVSVESEEPNGAASQPAPQPTAQGWRSIWTTWGWGFSNGAGAVQLVDPGGAVQPAASSEAAAGSAREAAAGSEAAPTFQPPGSGHSVAAMEEEEHENEGHV